ncbi:hypothetical protein GQ600_15561 [Phytophthora cactorum]|nr:hypothetical protein GQ600_15561 [Phytophthora cactorum]
MTGDVATTFRNISIHRNRGYLFAGLIDEKTALMVELSAHFGWTGSPGFYEIFGGAISHIHGCHTNAGRFLQLSLGRRPDQRSCGYRYRVQRHGPFPSLCNGGHSRR